MTDGMLLREAMSDPMLENYQVPGLFQLKIVFTIQTKPAFDYHPPGDPTGRGAREDPGHRHPHGRPQDGRHSQTGNGHPRGHPHGRQREVFSKVTGAIF